MHANNSEPWKVTLIDTGENTLTGGRLKKLYPYLKNEDNFSLHMGMVLSDVNFKKLYDFHCKHKKKATMTAIKPPGRYGSKNLQACGKVDSFEEKPRGDGGYINGGFFVLSKNIFNYLDDDNLSWEGQPLIDLVENRQLMALSMRVFVCNGYFKRKNHLNTLWNSNKAPWKTWKN